MNLEFIWDSNVVIYYLQHQLSIKAEQQIERILYFNTPVISVITEIELLSWRFASENDINVIDSFISGSKIQLLDEAVKIQTIKIRRLYKIKLPDAIIAATALVYDKTLLTRNVADFKKIDSLKLFNPLEE